MNILFLTLYRIEDIHNRGIYEDLLREFMKQGHNVYIVSPTERRFREKTHQKTEAHCHLLMVKTGNIQKTNLFEKGASTVLLEHQFISAIKTYLSDVKFDLILYSTPPITLAGVVRFVKQRDHAKTYLLLKDIFPQNAVDIGLMKKTGLKGIIYKYFRKKEKQLYANSDFIGCMSQANVEYILKYNSEIDPGCVEVCPNSIEPIDMSLSDDEKIQMRAKYGIPVDKKVFVYGGNLGKPQGIPFLIECLKSQKDNDKAFFLIVGDGTEYEKLLDFVTTEKQENVKLMSRLPKADYDRMIAACDVGMIFLDHRFTIPNFPSRLLSYMQAKLPVLAVTDKNTDIGKVILDGRLGWWCESNSQEKFVRNVDEILQTDITDYGNHSWNYLCDYYGTSKIYKTVFESVLTRIQQ